MAADTTTTTTTTTAEATVGSGLRGRDFRLLWTAESVSKTGTAVTTFALPLVALQTLGASTLMIGCQLASAILIVSVPLLAWLDALTMWYVLVIAFATGCSTVVFTAAYNAFVPLLVGKNELLGANTRLMGSEQAANVAGPGIGGLITQISSAVVGLLVDAVSFLVSAACLWSIRAREPSDRLDDRPPTTFRADILAAIGFVARDPYLRVITASSACTNLLMGGIQALVVVFLIQSAGLSPWAVGATTIMISVGGLLGAVVASKVSTRLGSARTLLTAPITDCFLLLFPLAGSGALLVLALAGTLVWATGVVVRNVTTGAFRQAYCPPGMRGRVAMTIRFVIFGVWPLGSLLGGVLGTVLDVRTALFILAGAAVLADGWLFVGPLKYRRDLPMAAADDGTGLAVT